MAQYAIAFDLNTNSLRDAGFTKSDITRVYQTEIPQALARAGFTVHAQGSLYHTKSDQDPIVAIMRLQNALRTDAPNFCGHVNRVHVFRMDEWSDVTELIAQRPAAGPPTGEEELEQQLGMTGSTMT